MVDWMFEVITAFKMSEQTFFLSVQYLDRFVSTTSRKLDISELHLIGITCMFIASKYEDYYPIKMKIVFEKIAHQKLKIEDIKQLELDVMQTI